MALPGLCHSIADRRQPLACLITHISFRGHFPVKIFVYSRISRSNLREKFPLAFLLMTPSNWGKRDTMYQPPDDNLLAQIITPIVFPPLSNNNKFIDWKMDIVFVWTAEKCHFIAILWCSMVTPSLWHSMADKQQSLASIITHLALFDFLAGEISYGIHNGWHTSPSCKNIRLH